MSVWAKCYSAVANNDHSSCASIERRPLDKVMLNRASRKSLKHIQQCTTITQKVIMTRKFSSAPTTTLCADQNVAPSKENHFTSWSRKDRTRRMLSATARAVGIETTTNCDNSCITMMKELVHISEWNHNTYARRSSSFFIYDDPHI